MQAVARRVRHQDGGEAERVHAVVGAQRSLAAQKGEVEPHIVPDDGPLADKVAQRGQYLVQARLTDQVLVGDAGEGHDLAGHGAAGVNQGAELVQHLLAPELDRADFNDRVPFRVQAGSFEIQCYIDRQHNNPF